jgi:integrase
MRLTDVSVRALALPAAGVKVHYDDTLKGFGVRVSQAGAKSFILAIGKNRDRVTIGRYPLVGLAEARDIARKMLAERTLGRHQTPKIALGAALDLFSEQHLAKLAPRTKKEIERLFTKHLAKLRTKKLTDITTHNITNITDKTAPSEGEHFHRACKTFFRWCVRRRLLQHSPIEGLELPSMWKPRERVLTDDELSTVWKAADEIDGHISDIVKLLILTGQRRGEIGSLKAEYCSLMGGSSAQALETSEAEGGATPPITSSNGFPHQSTICLPSTITKNKRQHTFPISALAADILSSNITTGTTSIFPARGQQDKPFNGWSKCKAQLDQKAKIAPWTLHDLRRTFATGLQKLGVRIEVIEQLLNHISGTRAGIVGVYQRHGYEAEMREAVEKWEAHLRTILDMRKEDELTRTIPQS